MHKEITGRTARHLYLREVIVSERTEAEACTAEAQRTAHLMQPVVAISCRTSRTPSVSFRSSGGKLRNARTQRMQKLVRQDVSG